MTTYRTGNAIGSADPRDLYDNAQNLDEAANSSADTFQDRLGKSRLTWAGIVKAGSGDPAIAVDAAARAESAASSVEQNAEQIAQDAAQQAASSVIADVGGYVSVAQNAADRAEAASSAAFVNADVYETRQAGADATVPGQQFQVVDGLEIVRYRREVGSTVEVARYPSGSIDSLTVNSGKTYPLKVMSRGGVVSSKNDYLDNILLDIKVLGGDLSKYYRVAYQQNGATLGGVSAYGWIIEEFDASTYETNPQRLIIHSYDQVQYGPQQQIIREEGGVQTVFLYPPSRPGLSIILTVDVSKLPPFGTPVNAYNDSSAEGWSWIVDPSCVIPSVERDNDFDGIKWRVYPDNTIEVLWRSASWIYKLTFGQKGPNLIPDIMGLWKTRFRDLDLDVWEEIVDTTNGGDWTGPYQVGAVDNTDGNTTSIYTGGNHGKNGGIGGGSTGKNILFKVYADGALIEPGVSGATGHCRSLKIISVNDVMAYNTIDFDRYVLRETCRYDLFPGVVGIKKHVEALESIVLRQDNGPQTFTTGFQDGSLLYYGKNNVRIEFTSTTNSGNKSESPDVWAVSFHSQVSGQLVAWMDRGYEAGDGRYVRDNWPYIRGGGSTNTKFYHAAVVSTEGVSLAKGDSYEWRGGWSWQPRTGIGAGIDSSFAYNKDDSLNMACAYYNGITVSV